MEKERPRVEANISGSIIIRKETALIEITNKGKEREESFVF